MSNSTIIEIGDAAVGLVTREDAQGAYRFFASDCRLHALEGRSFRQIRHVERLARELISSRAGTSPLPHLINGIEQPASGRTARSGNEDRPVLNARPNQMS